MLHRHVRLVTRTPSVYSRSSSVVIEKRVGRHRGRACLQGRARGCPRVPAGHEALSRRSACSPRLLSSSQRRAAASHALVSSQGCSHHITAVVSARARVAPLGCTSRHGASRQPRRRAHAARCLSPPSSRRCSSRATAGGRGMADPGTGIPPLCTVSACASPPPTPPPPRRSAKRRQLW